MRLALILAVLFIASSTLVGAQDNDSSWDIEAVRGNATTVEFTTDEGTWMNLDVSPDGSDIVFDLLGDIYIMPISGGQGAPSDWRPGLQRSAEILAGRKAHQLHQRPRGRRQHLDDEPRRLESDAGDEGGLPAAE
jgi:hypothetical protein